MKLLSSACIIEVGNEKELSMPIYSLKCEDCGYIEDYKIEFSEEEKCRLEPRHYDFEGVCECPKCSSTKFEKQITAHGKMACNWERWNVKR